MEGLSVVIPCYNEASRGDFYERIKQVVLSCRDLNVPFEVIFVSDGSTDKTVEVVMSAKNDYPETFCFFYSKNMGKGYAEKLGISQAKFQWILLMDGDLSVPLSNIKVFWDERREYAAMSGSRQMPSGRNKIRKLISNIGHKVTRRFLHINMEDTQCGFKMFRKQYASFLFSMSKDKTIQSFPFFKFTGCNKWLFDLELIMELKKRGLQFKEIAVDYKEDLPSTLKSFKAIASSVREMTYLIKEFVM